MERTLHKMLPFVYMWTGCDTTSAIYRQGEILGNASHLTLFCYKTLLHFCSNNEVNSLNHDPVISLLVRCHIFKFCDYVTYTSVITFRNILLITCRKTKNLSLLKCEKVQDLVKIFYCCGATPDQIGEAGVQHMLRM